MSISSPPATETTRRPARMAPFPERRLSQWGGVAALLGVALGVGTGLVVGVLGLPDASDVETLTDFADIENGRIAEHVLYLGALMLFALHTLVLYRLLRVAHPPAALFGAAVAEFGLLIMAASSMLHVATSPLADLYTSPDTPADDLPSIEYAWHAGQSVFDTMLATGVLLVPIGIVLLGIAMRRAPGFGSRVAWSAIAVGTVGTVGAAADVVDPGLGASAVGVLAIVVFNLITGWRTLTLGRQPDTTSPGPEPTPVD